MALHDACLFNLYMLFLRHNSHVNYYENEECVNKGDEKSLIRCNLQIDKVSFYFLKLQMGHGPNSSRHTSCRYKVS